MKAFTQHRHMRRVLELARRRAAERQARYGQLVALPDYVSPNEALAVAFRRELGLCIERIATGDPHHQHIDRMRAGAGR